MVLAHTASMAILRDWKGSNVLPYVYLGLIQTATMCVRACVVAPSRQGSIQPDIGTRRLERVAEVFRWLAPC
eukprot:m.116136 g.116136  ORF g.116136 m.116136 type:complete len:72 (+) comp10910_c0_seq1:1824-2039(+)